MSNSIISIEPSANGKHRPAAKRQRKAVKPAPVSAVARWATFGVGFTLILSAALNGYANAQHAPAPLAGWMMGWPSLSWSWC